MIGFKGSSYFFAGQRVGRRGLRTGNGDTRILCHDGDVAMENHVNTTGPIRSGCAVTVRRLTRAEVGRGALDLACAGTR